MRYVLAFSLILQLAATLPSFADDPKARAIMEKVDARDDGNNKISDMEMILIDKRGNERRRKIKTYSKDFGKDTYNLIFFLAPADVRSTGFLTYDYDDPEKDDDQWLYLPALKKTKRIATSDKSGSFMGSDFNYSDMTSRNIEDYDYKLLKESKVKGVKVWLIEAVPRSDDVIDETGYEKTVAFVRQDNHVVIRLVNWVKGGRLKYLDVKKLEKISGIWVALETTMTTKAGKKIVHKTVLINSNVSFENNLPDDLFKLRSLEAGIPAR